MITHNTRRGSRVIKQPPRGRITAHDELGQEKRGIIICPDCGNVHYKKHWWRNSDRGLHKLVSLDYRKAAHTLCPACSMSKQHIYEGEVVIENIPRECRPTLSHLIRNAGKTATSIDPQDRIIAVEHKGANWRVTTTENQLANKLARKIQQSLGSVVVRRSHSKEPYAVDRVRVVFTGGK